MLAQPLEQTNVAASVFEADEARHVAREMLDLLRAEDLTVARVDDDPERRRVRDLRDVVQQPIRIRMRVVGREHEDRRRAGAFGTASELAAHARTKADAGDDGGAPIDGVDRGLNDLGAFIRRQAEQLARAARRDESVHPRGAQPARVRADALVIQVAGRVVRRDREREDAAELRAQPRRVAHGTCARGRSCLGGHAGGIILVT